MRAVVYRSGTDTKTYRHTQIHYRHRDIQTDTDILTDRYRDTQTQTYRQTDTHTVIVFTVAEQCFHAVNDQYKHTITRYSANKYETTCFIIVRMSGARPRGSVVEVYGDGI